MKKIAVIGLEYVGFPLAVAFAEKYPVVGYNIDIKRIDELKIFHDATKEKSLLIQDHKIH